LSLLSRKTNPNPAEMTSLDLTCVPKTDPTEIYRYRDGIYAVDLLITAIVQLDFFTWLSRNPADRETICRSLAIAQRPTDVMLTFFTANRLVEKDQGVFRVTELAREHLVQGSPWYLGPYYASLKDRPVCQDLLAVLRTDKPANWGSSKGAQEWTKAMETADFAAQFTAAMDCRGAYLGQALAKRLDCRNHARLLDVAGGSGIYACAVAAEYPHLKATVLDKPPVDGVARQLIAQRGYADRVSVVAGDMFNEPFPVDCDVHLISNVLHDWDTPKVKLLLASSFRALPPGGLLAIHDAHINADKSGPLPVAEYSVILMHSTEGKCYSVTEMKELLEEAGFVGMDYHPTAADRSVIMARKPG
jgi:SAM-dependent methyltransferase